MLKLDDVKTIISEHADQLGDELMAEIGVKLLEHDVPDDNTELESLKAELEAERAGRAADKAEYVERINKFIYGGDPGGDPKDEKKPEDEVAVEEEEEKSFYERYIEEG